MNSLPDELLLLVVENLIYYCEPRYWRSRTRKLQPLCRVSRRLNRLVTPLLYAHIQGSLFISSKSWMKLTRTLQQNENLAPCVKTLEVIPRGESYGESIPWDIRLNLMQLWATVVRDLHVKDLWKLEKRLMFSGDNVLLTFILLRTTNLETLHLAFECSSWINMDCSRETKHPPIALEEFGHAITTDLETGVCRYESLRTLRIDLTGWDCFNHEFVLPFLALPNLESLKLCGWGLSSRSWLSNSLKEKLCWPVRMASIRSLSLRTTGYAPDMVFALLNACKTITHFRCDYVGDVRGRGIIPEWIESLSKALQIHGESIEYLVLAPCTEVEFEHSTIEHLNNMRNLRYLDIAYEILMVDRDASSIMQLLPNSLQFLTIRWRHQVDMADWNQMDSIIESISFAIADAIKNDLFPHLVAIELMLFHDASSLYPLPPPHRFSLPAFDIENTRLFLKDHGVHLDVSLCYDYHAGDPASPNEMFPATFHTMLALKRIFGGFVKWCKGHQRLKASTTPVPHIERDDMVEGLWPWSPYSWLWRPWDWENGEILEEQEAQ